MAYFPEAELKMTNRESLKGYRFANKNAEHNFCPNCGTSLFVNCDKGQYKGTFAVNVRTIDDLDPKTLKLKSGDGKSIQGL